MVNIFKQWRSLPVEAQVRAVTRVRILAICFAVCWACNVSAGQDKHFHTSGTGGTHRSEAHYLAEVVRKLPHDPDAFTEGLIYHHGIFVESTGLYGKSTLRVVEPETGRVLKVVPLKDSLFAEGIAVSGDRIAQLTWKAGKGLVYDARNLRQVDTFSYQGEGWGLTCTGQALVMSNGTDILRFIDPVTKRTLRTVGVTSTAGKVFFLNELEFVMGEIFANVWGQDLIARISPETGRVTGWIHLDGLVKGMKRSRSINVFNGIAWDEKNERLFVAIKKWPFIYEIRLIQQKP